MLDKSAKLQCGLGHKSLKIIYEGALIPILIYGTPVWEEGCWETQKHPQVTKSTEADKHQNC
jgi:hypothetical protein